MPAVGDTYSYSRSSNLATLDGGTAGGPGTFELMYDKDLVGYVDLLAAWSPSINTKALTYQVQPADSLALQIDFVVASKTTEADYVFVTGTDAVGSALTESVDVSAGNGTYTTTAYFKTISNIDCSDNSAGGGTVWADGTVVVRQNRWGVLREHVQGKHYTVDCNIAFGRVGNSSYFQSSNEFIWFSDNMSFSVPVDSALAIGTKTNGHYSDGAYWSVSPASTMTIMTSSSADHLMYCGSLHNRANNAPQWTTGDIEFGNFHLSNEGITGSRYFMITSGVATLTIDRLYVYNVESLVLYKSAAANRLQIDTTANGLYLNGVSIQVDNLRVTNETNQKYWVVGVNTLTLLNPIDVTVAADTKGSHQDSLVVDKYTCDIHVVDKDGNNLSGVTVLCENVVGSDEFSVATAAGGTITQQVIKPQLFNGSGAPMALATYNPFTFTLSKAGYPDTVISNVTVDGPIDWRLVMAAPPAAPTISAAAGTAQVTVTVDGDAGVTNYLKYKSSSQSAWQDGGSVSGDGDIVVTGLSNDTPYIFCVYSQASAGPYSLPSAALIVTLAETADNEFDTALEDTALDFVTVAGEDIKYLPSGGGSRDIKGIVNRYQPEGLGSMPHGNAPLMTVMVVNSSVTGISSPELNKAADKIELAIRIGEAVQQRRIVDIINQDGGMLELEVR